MKKILLYISIFISSLNVAFAQPGDEPRKGEKIQALYVAYITQELKLSETEAQKFWPVHAQFDNEIRALRPDMPELDRQQAALNVKKKYQDRFTAIIGSGRTDEFFRKDGEFRKKMIERLRQMKQQNPKGPGFMRRNKP
jgi:hypothetical protein